jgi:hypothetical protein
METGVGLLIKMYAVDALISSKVVKQPHEPGLRVRYIEVSLDIPTNLWKLLTT